MANLQVIVKYLEDISPSRLAFRGLKGHVKIGPRTENDQLKTTINKILIATYPSARAVTKASQDKVNLVIVLRPFLAGPTQEIAGQDLTRVRLLVKNYISLYVLSSGIIGVRDGLAGALADSLELNKEHDFLTEGTFVERVPLGKVCSTNSVMNHSKFANFVAHRMNLDYVLFSGDIDDEVKKILVTPGHYVNKDDVLQASNEGISTVVTGEIHPSTRLLAIEEGVNILELGAFNSEEPGMKRLRHQVSLEFPELKIDYTESAEYTKVFKY